MGGAKELWQYKGHEVILSGPYETGKTYAALFKLNTLLAKYQNSRGLMVRKTYKSLITSVVPTFENKVLPYPPGNKKCGLKVYGGGKPEWYDYPNGARLVLGGMDNAHRFLSSEFDFIYVPQVEELTIDDWETLLGRATGRAGNSPYAQVIGDCNPGPPTHWILDRANNGPLKLLKSKHEDNPTLFDRDGAPTLQGQTTVKILQDLTGIRYKRGYLGQWAGAEGQVYEFDPAIHLVDRFSIPDDWARYRSIDFGFTNPFICQWWAVDPDGRLYLYREIYHTHLLVEDAADLINELTGKEYITATIADHDAEDRATLHKRGIKTIAAKKSITTGIQKVEKRLKIAEDGKPRLYILRDCVYNVDNDLADRHKPVCTFDEFGGYVWPTTKANKAADEKPVKTDDHGLDGLRYMVMYLDGGTKRESRIW